MSDLDIGSVPLSPGPAPGPAATEDDLGVEKPLKLSTRAKLAKVDDDRVMTNPNGLEYIVKNYPKVTRVMKKRDAKLARRLASDAYRLASGSLRRRLKYENEADNLSTVLQFYQLWCHELFPKANFKDCIKLIRAYGHKSAQIKFYRRDLLDQVLTKLKEEKGIIDHTAPDGDMNKVVSDSELNAIAKPLATHSVPVDEDDDDDWSFMATKRNKHSLFIDDDDDDQLYRVPPASASGQPHPEYNLDDFSDSELAQAQSRPDEADLEMDLMREMEM